MVRVSFVRRVLRCLVGVLRGILLRRPARVPVPFVDGLPCRVGVSARGDTRGRVGSLVRARRRLRVRVCGTRADRPLVGRGQGRVRRAAGPARRRLDLAVGPAPCRAARALVPGLAARVEDRDGLHRLRGGPDRHQLGGPERGPLRTAEPGLALDRDRWRQRVAASAPHPRDTVAVDQYGRTGLQDRLVAGGCAVPVPVVGDPGVPAQPDRRERSQVGGDPGLPDAHRGGEGAALVRVRREELDLLLHVTARDVPGAPVQARVSAVDFEGAGAARTAAAPYGPGGLGRGNGLLGLRGRRRGERIGPGRRGGLQEDLAAGRAVAAQDGEADDRRRDHDGRRARTHQGPA